jgi:hypothetical protein
MVEMQFKQLTLDRGVPGLMAGLHSIVTFGLMAGMAGIPAYEVLKTIYEQYEQRVNGRTVDAELQLKELGIPEWVRKGPLSVLTGADVSKRLGQGLIGEQLMVDVLKGTIKVGDIGGVPGRTLQNTIDAASEVLGGSSSKNVLELVAPVLPTAFGNLAKAADLEYNPESALRTKQGNMLRDPKDIGTADVVRQGLGFSNLANAREKLYQRQRANQEFNMWKTRLAEGVAHGSYLMWQGQRSGDQDMIEAGRKQRTKLRDQMLSYTKANDIHLDTKFWTSFNASVAERERQKRNPGKIIKPTSGEKRHLEALTTD